MLGSREQQQHSVQWTALQQQSGACWVEVTSVSSLSSPENPMWSTRLLVGKLQKWDTLQARTQLPVSKSAASGTIHLRIKASQGDMAWACKIMKDVERKSSSPWFSWDCPLKLADGGRGSFQIKEREGIFHVSQTVELTATRYDGGCPCG